jgi:hypothetical protein
MRDSDPDARAHRVADVNMCANSAAKYAASISTLTREKVIAT